MRLPLRQRNRGPLWARFPAEIRLMIFRDIKNDGENMANLASVSKEWQAEFEPHIFSRIKLTPSRMADFGSMTHRNRHLVRYIWFCLELKAYNCNDCGKSFVPIEEWVRSISTVETTHDSMTIAFECLFSVLSTWSPGHDLTLDISVYSDSDTEHWFKYLTFLPDTAEPGLVGSEQEAAILDRHHADTLHKWTSDDSSAASFKRGLFHNFHSLMDGVPFYRGIIEAQWWNKLPNLPAVTHLLLRQQTRRRWKPITVGHMMNRLPNLREFWYEPWREWGHMQSETDRGEYQQLSRGAMRALMRRNAFFLRFTLSSWAMLLILPLRVTESAILLQNMAVVSTTVRKLVIFENFNQQYPKALQQLRGGQDMTGCQNFRIPDKDVAYRLVVASRRLEHLAASFIVDASHFFRFRPKWERSNLISLILTSAWLAPQADPDSRGGLLISAAAVAMKMPRLETLIIWTARKGLAAMFKYHVDHHNRQATITWKGSWRCDMDTSVVKAWKDLTRKKENWRFRVVTEVIHQPIYSHADAIRYLGLADKVLRPVSLQQIEVEQKALEGVPTV